MQTSSVRLGAAVAAALWPVRRRVGADPSGSSDAEARFNAGLTHLRDGRPKLALEEFQKRHQAGPQEPVLPQGPRASPTRPLKRFDDAVGRLPQGAGAEPVLHRRAQRPRAWRSCSPGKRAGGQGGVPGRLQRPHQPDAGDLGRATSGQAYFEEKNYAEAANWFRSSLNRNKAYPDAYLGLADALVALGRAEEALTHPGDRAPARSRHPPRSSSRWARRTTGPAASPTPGRGSRRPRKKDPNGAAARRAAELLKHFPK